MLTNTWRLYRSTSLMAEWVEYWSFHGPDAGFKSVKRLAEEHGISLTDEEAHRLVRDMTYHATVWLLDEFKRIR